MYNFEPTISNTLDKNIMKVTRKMPNIMHNRNHDFNINLLKYEEKIIDLLHAFEFYVIFT